MVYPMVTLGLPVYNGEKYLEKTIKCVLEQTYPNLQLIIVDNASTDNTEHICRKYADMYSNIWYYRNSSNIGVSANFNRVFKLSNSKYFKWVASDDLFSKDFVTKCVDVLESDPSIILCFTKSYIINENDDITGIYQYIDKISSLKVHERYSCFLGFSPDIIGLFGVFRSKALRKTRLFGGYVGSDRNLFAELSLIGRFYQLPYYLFYPRMHPHSYSSQYDKLVFKDHVAWWDPSGTSVNEFIHLKNSVEFLRSLFYIPVTTSERAMCLIKYIQYLLFEGWYKILEDFEIKYLGRSLFFSKIGYIYRDILQILPMHARIWFFNS